MMNVVSGIRSRLLVLSLVSCFFLVAQAALANPVTGEVSCDRGVDMPRMQALIKRTVAALRKDMNAVIQQINNGDQRWKDGYYYMFVFRGTTVLAHATCPRLSAGMSAALPTQIRFLL